ncbi:DUF4349 domain-containing protein [Lysobacter soli]|uniref:DUF4349 domain-containing protein n=1 Tax=Lysobacter soli TaxID=453783 RepID=UPI00209E53D6|nr:DUF4349 domain-containing protein [Lysobacter soli]UTA56099.1 DUF4349 domain-containing protein [Lysobacter soli]
MLAGCSRKEEAEAAADAAAMDVPHANLSRPAAGGAAAPARAKALSPPDMQTQLQSAANTQDSPGRRFIRVGSASFSVRDVYRAALSIEDLAANYGGFVERNNIWSETNGSRTHASRDGMRVELSTYTLRGSLIVRVPSERTQEFLRALAGQIEFLDERKFEATDAQFDLLRQQLAFARHQDAQAALAQVASAPGKTGDKADALGARADAQAQRDEATVARAELEDRIAFARIGLAVHQPPQLRRTERPDLEVAMRREGPGFFARVWEALGDGGRLGLDLIVSIAYLWPLWLAAALAVFGIRAWRRRGR